MGLYLNFKTKEAETAGLGARVIKDLTRNIVGKNHHIYCVNFFYTEEPIKQGFKVWTRSDSKNGFVPEFQSKRS